MVCGDVVDFNYWGDDECDYYDDCLDCVCVCNVFQVFCYCVWEYYYCCDDYFNFGVNVEEGIQGFFVVYELCIDVEEKEECYCQIVENFYLFFSVGMFFCYVVYES